MSINRYKSLFGVNNVNKIPPAITIRNRTTDLYVEYQEWDRLDLIAFRHYGYPELYWIILEANNYTIETEIPYGEILRIPFPLGEVISEIRGQVEDD
jgi:hypothetical protein